MPEELNIRMRVLADLGGAEQVARVVGKTADSADKLGKAFDKVDGAATKATKSVEGLTKANGGGSGETPISAMADDAERLAKNLENVEANAKQAATAVQRAQQQAAAQRPVTQQEIDDFARDPNAVDPTHVGPYRLVSEQDVLRNSPYRPGQDTPESRANLAAASAASQELPEHLTESLITPEIQEQLDSFRQAATDQESSAKQAGVGIATMAVAGVAAIGALKGAWRGYVAANPEVIGSLRKLRGAFEENLGRKLEAALDWIAGGDFAESLEKLAVAAGAPTKAIEELGKASGAFIASDLSSELEKQERAFDKATAAIQRHQQAFNSDIDRDQQQADDFTAEQLDAIEQDETLPESEKILRKREVQRKADEDAKDRASYKRHDDLTTSEEQLRQVEDRAAKAKATEDAVKKAILLDERARNYKSTIDGVQQQKDGQGWFVGNNTPESVRKREAQMAKLREQMDAAKRESNAIMSTLPPGIRNDIVADPDKMDETRARRQETVRRLEEERKRATQEAELLRPDVAQKRYDVAAQDLQESESLQSRSGREDAKAQRESDAAKAQESAKVIDEAKGKADEAQAEVDKQARDLQSKLEQLAQDAAQKNEATGAFLDALAKGLEDGIQKGELEKIQAAMANFTSSANKAFADLSAAVVANTKSIEQASAAAADAKKTAENVRIFNSQTL